MAKKIDKDKIKVKKVTDNSGGTAGDTIVNANNTSKTNNNFATLSNRINNLADDIEELRLAANMAQNYTIDELKAGGGDD